MSDDIVERLRAELSKTGEWVFHDYPSGISRGPFDQLRLGAAEEIKTLRLALATVESSARTMVENQGKEIARLQGELVEARRELGEARVAVELAVGEGMEEAAKIAEDRVLGDMSDSDEEARSVAVAIRAAARLATHPA